jgi:IQ calmodulin-binding motif
MGIVERVYAAFQKHARHPSDSRVTAFLARSDESFAEDIRYGHVDFSYLDGTARIRFGEPLSGIPERVKPSWASRCADRLHVYANMLSGQPVNVWDCPVECPDVIRDAIRERFDQAKMDLGLESDLQRAKELVAEANRVLGDEDISLSVTEGSFLGYARFPIVRARSEDYVVDVVDLAVYLLRCQWKHFHGVRVVFTSDSDSDGDCEVIMAELLMDEGYIRGRAATTIQRMWKGFAARRAYQGLVEAHYAPGGRGCLACLERLHLRVCSG